MTPDEAIIEVRDHYAACCEENRALLDAARVLVVEVEKLRELAEILRSQRDDARAQRL